jgi:amyloid beta precursor protein binding protein 1
MSRSKANLVQSVLIIPLKASTQGYVQLQNMYRAQALEERNILASMIDSSAAPHIPDGMLEAFTKNAHRLRVIKGEQFGALDLDQKRIGKDFMYCSRRRAG